MPKKKTALILVDKDGMPAAVDISIAWHGLKELDYDIQTIDDMTLYTKGRDRDFSVYDLFVGDVTSSHVVLNQLGKKPEPICYPKELESRLRRKIERITLKEAYNYRYMQKFVKPVNPKLFTGCRIEKLTHQTYNMNENELIYISDIVTMLSEFRVYIYKNDIKNICNYTADSRYFPSAGVIESMVSAYISNPICYALDVAVNDNLDTILVEVNDFYAIGNYGLDAATYVEMLQARWNEILGR